LRRRQAQNNWGNDPAGGMILSLQCNLSRQMVQEECFCAQSTVVPACCFVADKPNINDKNHIKHSLGFKIFAFEDAYVVSSLLFMDQL
jgi:hypothetical protein